MKRFILFLGICLGLAAFGHAQSKNVKALVDSQNYVFKAQTAIPLGGNTRNLTTDYDLRISREKVASYLPYFGRAYTAPMDATKSALEFTSKSFDYNVTPGKKQGWTVTIKPKDNSEVQQMILTISSEGYAQLQVLPTNRQAITFNGIVTAPANR